MKQHKDDYVRGHQCLLTVLLLLLAGLLRWSPDNEVIKRETGYIQQRLFFLWLSKGGTYTLPCAYTFARLSYI